MNAHDAVLNYLSDKISEHSREPHLGLLGAYGYFYENLCVSDSHFVESFEDYIFEVFVIELPGNNFLINVTQEP